MPFKSNRFYHDPAIGAAFENLAAAFAPPSGADAAGWARANAEREAASRLSWLFENSGDPTASARSALTGVQDYAQTPGGFATSTETLRRGQDLDASTARYGADQTRAAAQYGHDRTYAASRENNTADNARAIETNAADNARSLQANEADNERALADRRLQETGALERLYAAPVKVAQGERAYLPAQTAEATGLAPQLNGADKPMSTDEVAAMALQAMPAADRDQMVRDKFAPTETQVQGQERTDLRARGLLTDDDLVASIMGEQTPVEAIGPEGKPIYMSPGEAVRTGAQPVQNKSSDPAPKVENWIGPDGNGGIAVFDRATNQYVDTSTKQPLPAGSRTYTGQLQGGAEATGFGKTTEAQDKNAYAATMAEAPTDRLLKAFDTGQLPTTQDYVVFNLMSKVPTAAAPALVSQMSESGQTFYQDLRTALPFQLMTQSGAAVTEQEYDRKLLELIPVPGEASAVTKAKRENFATYLKAVRSVSGAAYDKIHAGGDIAKPALPGAAPTGALATGGPVRVASPDEARKLPSGTAIILPDGSEGRVP